nr:hypothetical protein HmN_000129400 [Hymenolepis microstoma]
MGGERADYQPDPKEEVSKRETRDATVVGGSESRAAAMSNPVRPFGELLTYGFIGYAMISRNQFIVLCLLAM